MKVVKKRNFKRVRSFFLKTVAVFFVLYISFALISQHVQISRKKSEIQALNGQLSAQNVKNDELRKIANSNIADNKAYIECIARSKLGLSKDGEKVFVNVTGN